MTCLTEMEKNGTVVNNESLHVFEGNISREAVYAHTSAADLNAVYDKRFHHITPKLDDCAVVFEKAMADQQWFGDYGGFLLD